MEMFDALTLLTGGMGTNLAAFKQQQMELVAAAAAAKPVVNAQTTKMRNDVR